VEQIQALKEGRLKGKTSDQVDPEHGVAMAAVSDTLRAANMPIRYNDAKGPEDANNALILGFHAEYFRAVDAENGARAAAKKPPMTAAEQRELAGKLLVQTVTGPSWWQTKSPHAFAQEGHERFAFTASEVPPAVREAYLRIHPGATPQEIQSDYNAGLQRAREKKAQAEQPTDNTEQIRGAGL
jgi:hypothetical protein